MCGIIGVVKFKGEIEGKEVIEMLKRLEYRGYDSWGIGILNNGSIFVEKKVGKISNAIYEQQAKGKAAIAHTRWATHGKVNEKNAHPHLSFDNSLALVHNGIIENYDEIRELLKRQGYKFFTETDSEVAANFLHYLLKHHEDKEALTIFDKEVKGSFAIVALHKDKVYVLVRGSPLLTGFNDVTIYFASDAKAFIDKAKEITYFNDDEAAIVDLSTGNIIFIDMKKGKKISKNPETINKELYDTYEPLNGYPHYTIKEIEEQPMKINEVLAYNEKALELLANDINDAYGIFFVASGSSYNAALASSYLFSKHAHKHVNVVDAAEFEYYKHFITSKTLVVAISQSGETADVIEAVKTAKNKGAKIVSIVNVYGSTLMRLSDYAILLHVGSEISVVATKSYVAQLLLLIILIFKTMALDFNGEVKRVAELMKEMINDDGFKKGIRKLAEELKNKEHLYLIGRGVNYATALEGALKIKEISYVHADAFAGGALKHGSIALIDNNSDVIVIASEDETFDEIISNALEVKARGARIIGISSKYHEVFDVHIAVPKANILQPLINIIPLQLLAYYLALERGADPDKPRNLAKSVTVK